MALHTFVEFEMSEAEELADLTGIRYDLDSARSLAKRLQAVMKEEKLDYELIDALTTAILVRYNRPFAKGVRRQLNQETLDRMSESQRRQHERLRDFRNKHIVHSVNSFEENQLIARYVEERVDCEGVYAVECHHVRVVGLNSRETENVVELTTLLIEHVDRLLDREKNAVLDKVKSIPFEQLMAQSVKCKSSRRRPNINKRRKQ